MPLLLALGAIGGLALWLARRNEAPLAGSNVNPPVDNAATTNEPAQSEVRPASPSSPQPTQTQTRMLVLRLDIRVSDIEQMLGGIDRAWVRTRIDPVVADIVPEARREVGWPPTGSARSGVQEVDGGFRVVVAWPISIATTEQQRAQWRTWIEARLRRSEDGDRIRNVTLYVRDA